jgi:hypothetical protein
MEVMSRYAEGNRLFKNVIQCPRIRLRGPDLRLEGAGEQNGASQMPLTGRRCRAKQGTIGSLRSSFDVIKPV